ncbi:DedA family protein [Actinoplanes sp. CA-142083]|uniref:DedA family protein n=1 Tax=Actinoplanes sp. CA-142083 TaxID=3239903 RepID=UPI003D8A92D0
MSLLDPQHLISAFGLLGLMAIVFAESGLLIGFFLPGDSLLFAAGLLAPAPLWVLCLAAAVAAVAGDQVGYAFGRRVGPAALRRRAGHYERARQFFDRYGASSIVLARFVPVVRTFTPILAGAVHMHYRTFLRNNVVGAVLWAGGVTALGHFLGRVPFVRGHIELILVAIVAVSVVPVGVRLVRGRAGSGKSSQ